MNIKKIFTTDPFSLLLVASLLILTIITVTDFNQWNELKALLYPTTTTDEIKESGSASNKLRVLAFKSDHGRRKNYSFNNNLNISISDRRESFTVAPPAGGTTPYLIESDEDMKNIILEAPGTDFVGWSGCDADTGTRCQVSVTDHQIRKVEAHYSNPEPRLPLQLWSVSNNEIQGFLPGHLWNVTNPRVGFKAANNRIEGGIPPSIDSLAALQLNLGRNRLEDEIPFQIGYMPAIQYLGLYKNILEDEIPITMGELTTLRYLLLYDNLLEDEIPWQLGNLRLLVRFELHDNLLEGEVPHQITNISGLIPSELRLYNNLLEEVETGFMKKAPWDGINFHNNRFSSGAILDALDEAAQNSGEYIDFCGNNPVVNANYSVDGQSCSLNVPQEVNDAAEAWDEIYVDVQLTQDTVYYTGECSGGCSGEVNTRDGDCIKYDEGGLGEEGNCLEYEEIEYCSYSSECDPDTEMGNEPPENFSDPYCIMLEESWEGWRCEDTDYIPDEVDHRAEENDCDTYTHPECRPVCESGGCTGRTSPPCSASSGFYCRSTGETGSGWDNSENEADDHDEECGS